jgi:hypothetical protein
LDDPTFLCPFCVTGKAERSHVFEPDMTPV